MVVIFIVIAALQVKVGKVISFVGKIFVVRPSTTKTTNLLPQAKITLYTVLFPALLLSLNLKYTPELSINSTCMVLFEMRDDIILIKFVSEYVSINGVHEAILS